MSEQHCFCQIPALDGELSQKLFALIRKSQHYQLYFDFLAAQTIKQYLDCSEIETEVMEFKDLVRPAIVLVLPNQKRILCQGSTRQLHFNFHLFNKIFGVALVDFKEEYNRAQILPFISCQPIKKDHFLDPILSKLFNI